MRQTTPSYTQLGRDRGFEKQPGLWGFSEGGGDEKNSTFHSEVTLSVPGHGCLEAEISLGDEIC